MEYDYIFFIRMKLKVSVSGATSLHPFYEAVSIILVFLAALLAARGSRAAIGRFQDAFWKRFLPRTFATLGLLLHHLKLPRHASAV